MNQTVIIDALGFLTMGEDAANSPASISFTLDDLPAPDRPRSAAMGWRHFAERVYSRSYLFPVISGHAPIPGAATISFSTASGALLGNIRTDCQFPLVRSLEFITDENGCADFTMTLNSFPPFPIHTNSLFTVTINNANSPQYTGYILYNPQQGIEKGEYKYTGFGLRKQIPKRLDSTAPIFAAGQKPGVIAKNIFLDYVANKTSIRYNESKIDLTIGTPTASDIDFGDDDITKIMDSLAKMAGAEWGVDGAGEFYFLPPVSSIVRTFFIGYDCGEFDSTLNDDAIKNSIFVERKQGRGSGGAGWSVAAIMNDDDSISNYGLHEYRYRVPGYFADTECQTVGNSILNENSEPQLSGSLKKLIIGVRNEILTRGLYRFIMPVGNNENEIFDCESTSGISKSGGGDLAYSTDTAYKVRGARSLKLQWTAADGDYIKKDVDVNERVREIRFYVMANRSGMLLEFGFGTTTWSDNLINVPVTVPNIFNLFRWNVFALNMRRIGQIGFRIIDSTVATTARIDFIEAVTVGHRHYILKMKRNKNIFATDGQYCDADFGPLPATMQDYMAELFAKAESARAAGEIR